MHRNARLTPAGRLLLCERIEAGWPVAHAAVDGDLRDRAYVWWRRYQAEGVAGLEDRSSRPHRSPTRPRPPGSAGSCVCAAAGAWARPASPGSWGCRPRRCIAVLVRHGLNRLDHLDRVTRAPIRRMEMTRPGELVHVDIKKLGRIPEAAAGESTAERPRPNNTGRPGRLRLRALRHRRLQPPRLQRSPQRRTRPHRAAFWPGPCVLRRPGITIERVLTDNGACYRSQPSPPRSATSCTPAPGPTGPDQRQGRTLQPHPARRMGLRPTLDLRRPTHPRLTAGSTSTTITDTTPPSAAHPSAASATCPGTTARPRAGRRALPAWGRAYPSAASQLVRRLGSAGGNDCFGVRRWAVGAAWLVDDAVEVELGVVTGGDGWVGRNAGLGAVELHVNHEGGRAGRSARRRRCRRRR